MSREFLVVGRVIKAHGLKGLVEVKVETDNVKRFSLGSKLFLWPPVAEWPYLTIEAVKEKKDRLLVKFFEVTTKSKADLMAGHNLVVPLQEAEKPAATFWLHEIIGLDVFTDSGQYLGKITEVLRTGANDVYVVKNSKEYLLPAIKEVIKEVNIEAKKVIVHLLPGLEEL